MAKLTRSEWLRFKRESGWRPGFPPGRYYPGMERDYEVQFTPMAVWHRRRPQNTPDKSKQ